MSLMEDLIIKSKSIIKRQSMPATGIEPEWGATYASIARLCRDDRESGLCHYLYEPGPSVWAFAGGFFEHRKWSIRRMLERQSSMKHIALHDATYVIATCYWLVFHKAAF